MPICWKKFVQRWAINTLAVLVAANLVHGIEYETVGGLVVASLLLGVLNAFLRPVMLLLSLPLVVLTFGLFVLVINAFLLYFVGALLQTFRVASFGAAFWGALVIGVVSLLINALLGSDDSGRGGPRASGPPSGDGQGPIIDV